MKIAIVEDNKEYIESLSELINRYGKEHNTEICINTFENGELFINGTKQKFDIIFMDIEMPMMDGITAGNKLREVDSQAVVIFVSNYMKYAIKGYSVNALDYLTKPVDYATLSNTMDKAILSLKKKVSKSIVLADSTDNYRVDINDILYIEVYKHRLFYHTTHGDYDIRGSLTECEKELPSNQFIRCNSGYIINLKYVTSISHDNLMVMNTSLPISRNRKKEVLDALTRFVGE